MAKQSSVKSRRKLLNPVFHLHTKEEDDSQLTQGIIKLVRRTGQLNLSGRSLTNVPENMFSMYELNDSDSNTGFDFGSRKEDDENWWQFQPLTYLDLSSNVIQKLPPQIGLFQDLSTLNLQDNSITNLPQEIGKLCKLTKLNLCHNRIETLPADFYKLGELQCLLLADNKIVGLPKNFCDLVMLRELDLSMNNLTNLPIGIGYLVRLSQLNVSSNKLVELPLDIVNLRGLIKLDLTHNELTSLPDTLGEMTKLQCLYAQHNNIEKMSIFEGGRSHIQEIHLGNNYIKVEIPSELCENVGPTLKILDLKDNKIEQVPPEIANLQHLIRLDLTNNDLSDLPNSMGLLPHLQNLQLEGNKMKKIRTDVIKGGTTRILKFLREKIDAEDLVVQKPKFVPSLETGQTYPDRYMMRNSRALNLAMKNVTHVPNQVFEDALTAEITVADLCKNKLASVPSGVEIIATNLTELNLSMNCLTEIPEFIGNCLNLKYLDLGNNLLETLPSSLGGDGKMGDMRELVLSYNKFTTIPPCSYSFKNLEILLVSNNKINEIDINGLKNLKRLATLDLGNNNISQVPFELGNMTQLRCLELKGNCLRQPRYGILEQGTETILSYLRDRIAN